LVADSKANRVLIWTSPAAMNAGEPADLVLGQTSFTASSPGLGPGGLDGPRGGWTDGTTLIVADSGNARVLVWDVFPSVDGAPADRVLGQSDFDTKGAPFPPTAASTGTPSDAFYDGERLYVADPGSNRVMIWDSMPLANGPPADVIVGQPGPSSGQPNAGGEGPNDIGLDSPTSVHVASGSLFITDMLNSRVVVHTPVPTTDGEAADAVLGQAGFTSNAMTTTADGLYLPDGVASAGTALFVCDRWNSRVLRYRLSP
jgi:hypothetical protein